MFWLFTNVYLLHSIFPFFVLFHFNNNITNLLKDSEIAKAAAVPSGTPIMTILREEEEEYISGFCERKWFLRKHITVASNDKYDKKS